MSGVSLPTFSFISKSLTVKKGFPNGLVGEESAYSAGDTGDASSVPGSVRFPRGGNGNPLQYPCLENSMDRGAWQALVHRVSKRQTRLID